MTFNLLQESKFADLFTITYQTWCGMVYLRECFSDQLYYQKPRKIVKDKNKIRKQFYNQQKLNVA